MRYNRERDTAATPAHEVVTRAPALAIREAAVELSVSNIRACLAAASESALGRVTTASG